jgi:hypothetical protein
MKLYPFCEFSLGKAKKGEFNRRKMDKIVLELMNFEVINDTYYVK